MGIIVKESPGLELRNNRFVVLFITILLLISFNNIQAQDWEEITYKIPTELLGATAGYLIIGIPVAILAPTSRSDYEMLADKLLIGTIAGGCIGAPTGTFLTGKAIGDEGSSIGSYIGGALGTGLGYLTFFVSYKYFYSDQGAGWPIIASFFSLPIILSVAGYKLFPYKSDHTSLLPNNFPQIGLSVLPEKHDSKITPKIGANALFRF